MQHRRLFDVLSAAGLIGAVGATASALAGASGSPGPALLLIAASTLLAAALRASGRPSAGIVMAALVALAAVILAVEAANAAAGSSPRALSALGALIAFVAAPGACAYGMRTWRGFGPAVLASAAVPLIFALSIVLDGPILQGAGPAIDRIDAAIVPGWLAFVAARFLVSGPG